MFGSYGVRVPAIIVSPWIEPRTVSHTLFDHTSIIKTILSRFCPEALHQPQRADAKQARPGPRPRYPGLRVSQASHLSELLTRTTPRAAPPRDTLVRQAAARAGQTEANQPRPGHAGTRRPSAQRPAEKHPGRDPPTQKGWTPIQRTVVAGRHSSGRVHPGAN